MEDSRGLLCFKWLHFNYILLLKEKVGLFIWTKIADCDLVSNLPFTFTLGNELLYNWQVFPLS